MRWTSRRRSSSCARSWPRLPRVELAELVLEVALRTGFTEAFTHLTDRSTRTADFALSLCAALLAEARLSRPTGLASPVFRFSELPNSAEPVKNCMRWRTETSMRSMPARLVRKSLGYLTRTPPTSIAWPQMWSPWQYQSSFGTPQESLKEQLRKRLT